MADAAWQQGDREPSSSARPKNPSTKFTPSGDPDADFRQIARIRDSLSLTCAFRQLLSSVSPDAIANLMKSLKRFGENQEHEDRTGGLMALMALRQLVIEHAAETDSEAALICFEKSWRSGLESYSNWG